jgi:hypothetical protein
MLNVKIWKESFFWGKSLENGVDTLYLGVKMGGQGVFSN